VGASPDGATHTYGYTYDLANRLATVTIDGSAASSYTYDGNGNATSATVRGVTSAGAYDAQDRVTSYGGETYGWTAQGELASKTDGSGTTTYANDSQGRLQSVTLATGHVVSYVYDGSNRRVGKKLDGTLVQGFLYRDGIKPVVELDGAGNVVSRFVYGSNPVTPDYVIKGGNTYKIFSDQIGSPRVVVDVSSGAVVERVDYDERGNTLKDTNAGFIPFGFAGGIVDRDTGLIRFGARDYDPSVGRWTEKDPIGPNGGMVLPRFSGHVC
jgi:RHS repeat-associated protein